MAALTLTAPALPAAVGPLAGVADGGNVNGMNSASLEFAGGSTGADTIANADILAALPTGSRIREVFNTTFASQADLDKTLCALGFQGVTLKGGGALAFVTAAPGKPTATITTTAATGYFRMALAASVSR